MKGKAKPAKADARAPSAALPKRSLVAQAYESIKRKIITLHFLPGQYLNESALCAQLQLGRTPVHQALQRLHLEGLVEVMPRKGVIVLPDSISEIMKILESRLTVEPELARQAAKNATAGEAKELKTLAITDVSRNGATDIERFTENDRAFHRRIGEISGNHVMSDFAHTLHERSIRYWYLHLWQTLDIEHSNRQHAAIAAEIARGNGDGAAKMMTQHISTLHARLASLPQSRGAITSPRRDKAEKGTAEKRTTKSRGANANRTF